MVNYPLKIFLSISWTIRAKIYLRRIVVYDINKQLFTRTRRTWPSALIYRFTPPPPVYIYALDTLRRDRRTYTYVHHGLIRDWNKLPSCECELFVGCRDDEEQTALKWDRSSHPVAPPGRVSHPLCLEIVVLLNNLI
jgi:hypothetical protein